LNTGAVKRPRSGLKALISFQQGKLSAPKYRREQQRLRDRLSRGFQTKIETVLRRAVFKITTDIRNNVEISFPSVADQIYREVDAVASSQINRIFSGIWAFDAEKYKNLESKAEAQSAYDFGATREFQSSVTRYLSERQYIFAGISNSVSQRIYNEIQKRQLDGQGVAQISSGIKSWFNETYKSQAATIARTETHSAAGNAHDTYHTAISDAYGIAMLKRWVATGDARTRSAHAQMNGIEVALDSDFVMPNGALMSYCGDSRGGAANTVNCRCVIMYVDNDDVIDDPEKDKKMDFSGKVLNEDPFEGVANTVFDYEDVMTKQVTAQQLALQKTLPIPTFTTKFKKNEKGETVNRGFYNSQNKQVTTLARNNEGFTLTHEYGHHVDYAIIKKIDTQNDGFRGQSSFYYAWSETSGRFKRAYNADKKKNGFVGRKIPENIEKWRDKLYKISGTWPSGRPKRIPKDMGSSYFSDIIDAMSGGRAFSEYGMFGHGKGYYRRKGARYKETFANLYALRSTKEWKEIEVSFPNLAKLFDEVVSEALDAGT
jgi:hypothetical protein